MNIVEQIRAENRGRTDAPAVVDGERAWSYGELLDSVGQTRRVLEQTGIGPGSRVAFRCADGFDYIVGSLALLEAGAAVVPVATSLTAAEQAETMDRIDVHGLLLGPRAAFAAPQDAPSAGGEGSPRFTYRARAARDDVPETCRRLRPAFIRFSSGTTGSSKGVVLAHRTIYERTEAANEGLHVGPSDRILWVLSMSHHFVVSILLFLRKGATIVIGHRAFPASVAETAAGGEITFIYASPFHYEILAQSEAVPADALGGVRLALSTAMKLSARAGAAFARRFGFELTEAYGIIEVGLPFINLTAGKGSRGTVGRILPAYRMKLADRDAEGIGEVLLRGKGMLDAYFSPWQPREEVLEDGWFRTGDLGRLDEDGNLCLAGRRNAVINCAGLKVFPAEVEGVLNAHPGVAESLVYGAEHAVYGQVPEASIVAAAPDVDADALIAELRRYGYRELSPHKVPKAFNLVAELPRTSTGKLLRR